MYSATTELRPSPPIFRTSRRCTPPGPGLPPQSSELASRGDQPTCATAGDQRLRPRHHQRINVLWPALSTSTSRSDSSRFGIHGRSSAQGIYVLGFVTNAAMEGVQRTKALKSASLRRLPGRGGSVDKRRAAPMGSRAMRAQTRQEHPGGSLASKPWCAGRPVLAMWPVTEPPSWAMARRSCQRKWALPLAARLNAESALCLPDRSTQLPERPHWLHA